jgi:hypothetical protein
MKHKSEILITADMQRFKLLVETELAGENSKENS